MNYQYPTGYFAESVPSHPTDCRYALKITTPAVNQPYTLFVLMMNPSVAEQTASDKTIDTLIKNYGTKYRQIVVVNTTPVIESKSVNLKNRVNEIRRNMLSNTKAVTRMVRESGYFHFLIATGNVIKGVNEQPYIDLMNHIDSITRGDALFTIRLTSNGYGGHPLYKKAFELQNLTKVKRKDANWHLVAVN